MRLVNHMNNVIVTVILFLLTLVSGKEIMAWNTLTEVERWLAAALLTGLNAFNSISKG